MAELKKALGLAQATFFGVGLILGAGIYVVIGKTAGYAGYMVWLAVFLSGLISLFTGLSYAELSSMYPKAGSSYFYVKEAFPKLEWLGFIVGWLIFFEALSGGATASIGFALYLSTLLNAPMVVLAMAAAIVFSIVNFLGIEESSGLNIVFTLIETAGLIMVIILGFFFGSNPVNYFEVPPQGFMGIMLGTSLIFFAYVGFELMATTAEETKDAERTLPKAIILALAICTLLYMLVAIAVVRLLPWQILGTSSAPLSEAVATVIGSSAIILTFIALFSTSNTVLGFLVSASRISYGMAADGIIDPKLATIHPKTRTPQYTVALAGILAVLEIIVAGFYENAIDIVAKASNLGCLLAFIFINAAVIKLRLDSPDKERAFKIPLNIGKIPLIPIFGILSSIIVIAIAFHEVIVWVITGAIMLLGFIIKRR
ncbi:MAG: APC family permease [Candidatus Njordarchaeales archaeon]